MRKRAGLARALALDPPLLFLDEPTAGLDPIGASAFDHLIRTLQQALGLTVFLITHDLDTLYAICDRVAVLADRKVVARSEEHTSELQSLMRISYAVFCLKKNKLQTIIHTNIIHTCTTTN